MFSRFGFVLVDGLCVVVFVVLGRRTHEGLGGLGGVLHTAWPFLVGLVVGWLVSRAWVRPFSLVPVGVVLWVSTVVVGMILRRVSGQGTAFAFVVVAFIFLGVTLLGWRGIGSLVLRRRT
ncbi:DUF3054 domain-containing protein [Actinomadura rubteroloni]|uniref:DUF3054 domain-containing protein n=1 Tax=Actinomadura rubteroloni TaxID=1926885 RepID=UPI000CD929E4|nr:DUF3054 domain-containing protein [Actinomadura rubteroloni]